MYFHVYRANGCIHGSAISVRTCSVTTKQWHCKGRKLLHNTTFVDIIVETTSTTFWQTVFDNTHDDWCLKHSSLFYILMSLRNCYGQISCILIFHTLVFMISNISTFDGIIMFHSKFEFQLRKPEIIL